jgi:3-dehydroquinate synthase
MTQKIQIRLAKTDDRSYTVTVKSGLMQELPRIVARAWRGRDVFIIADSTVSRLYGRKLLRGLVMLQTNAFLLDFPEGERSKSAEVVFSLHSRLLAHGIRRNSLVIALGGGVVGDVAGFVAATVLRGVRFIQVPTTLLAQVDSSVGGKVGIDHPVGKNLIGAFHQPGAVFVDPAVLRTLPDPEFRNGLAEIVKIAAGLDRKFFGRLERFAGRINRRNLALLSRFIADAIALKAAVVEHDEFETGLRTTLNLGHTIGHAIEASTGYVLRHGAAVAIGLAAESRIAVELGILKARDFERLVGLLRDLRLPTEVPSIRNAKKFLAALSADKKRDGSGTRFVLLNGIGKVTIGVRVPLDVVGRVCGVPQ